MPEYLVPGVYVEEVDSTVTPIPGVSTSIDDATARQLIDCVRRIVGPALPDWTQVNDSDPGVTLIRLFAWLGESLLYRAGDASYARREAAFRALAGALGTTSALCVPPRRPRFFAGQLLDAATLEAEQDYHRDVHRRHNLALHGAGIVSGLGVQIDASGAEPWIVVEPGYGIDPRGEELALCVRARLRLPERECEAFVSLRRWDRPCDPIPGPDGTHESRIEEACIVAVSASVPAAAVMLARVTRGAGGVGDWSVDSRFSPSATASRDGGGDPTRRADS